MRFPSFCRSTGYPLTLKVLTFTARGAPFESVIVPLGGAILIILSLFCDASLTYSFALITWKKKRLITSSATVIKITNWRNLNLLSMLKRACLSDIPLRYLPIDERE